MLTCIFVFLFLLFSSQLPDGENEILWTTNNDETWHRRQIAVGAITILFLIPLSWMHLQKLSWIVIFSLPSVLFQLAAVIAVTPDKGKPDFPGYGEYETIEISNGWIGAVGSMSLVFCAHYLLRFLSFFFVYDFQYLAGVFFFEYRSPKLYVSTKNPTFEKVRIFISFCIHCSFCLFIIHGIHRLYSLWK